MIRNVYRSNRGKLVGIFAANKQLPSVVLPNIFTAAAYAQLQKYVVAAAYHGKNHPIEYRYDEAKLPKAVVAALNDPEVLQLITAATGKKAAAVKGKLLRLSHRSYTLLNDKAVEKPGIDVVISFSSWQPEWGGNVTYFSNGIHIPLLLQENTLAIVQRKQGVQKYVKYVNNKAGKNKRYVLVAVIA